MTDRRQLLSWLWAAPIAGLLPTGGKRRSGVELISDKPSDLEEFARRIAEATKAAADRPLVFRTNYPADTVFLGYADK